MLQVSLSLSQMPYLSSLLRVDMSDTLLGTETQQGTQPGTRAFIQEREIRKGRNEYVRGGETWRRSLQTQEQ